MRQFKLVLAFVLLGAVLAFVAGNTTPVTFRFLIWETPGVSLSLVAAMFFLLGILFTLLIGLLLRLRKGGQRTAAATRAAPSVSETSTKASQPQQPHGKDENSP